ncbi:MAG: PTS sugar transporter subunit IIC [Enterobacteriaceae bacterium]
MFYFLCVADLFRRGTSKAIDVLPERLIDGLGVAGGIMPLSAAVLLKIMMKNIYIPYFIIGLSPLPG